MSTTPHRLPTSPQAQTELKAGVLAQDVKWLNTKSAFCRQALRPKAPYMPILPKRQFWANTNKSYGARRCENERLSVNTLLKHQHERGDSRKYLASGQT